MKNFLNQSPESPTHISVAALLRNSEGEILMHHFKKDDLPDESEGKGDLYLVMRESLHLGESLEAAVARGLMEEYGATGTIVDFLGTIVSHFPCSKDKMIMVEKTVLYFLVELVSIDESLREAGAVESRSQLLWLSPAELLEKNMTQAARYSRTDIDDSKVIRDYMDRYIVN
jgi:ADP-ribose pyrophosphatase YjhB (NUDIX family)